MDISAEAGFGSRTGGCALSERRKERRLELEGKRVVVTGAAQGLGRAYAEQIAREGASVLVNDVDPTNCTDVAIAIRKAGGTVAEYVGPCPTGMSPGPSFRPASRPSVASTAW